jgi:putative membrane protein
MGYGFPLGMHTFGGGIVMLLFWGAIIVGVALLVIGLGRPNVAPASRDVTPLEILKRRYASGEIDHDEFEQIKESLLR